MPNKTAVGILIYCFVNVLSWNWNQYRKPPDISDIETFGIIILEFEQSGLTVAECIKKMQMEWQTV